MPIQVFCYFFSYYVTYHFCLFVCWEGLLFTFREPQTSSRSPARLSPLAGADFTPQPPVALAAPDVLVVFHVGCRETLLVSRDGTP